MKQFIWWTFVVLTCPVWAPFTVWYLMKGIGEVVAGILTDLLLPNDDD